MGITNVPISFLITLLLAVALCSLSHPSPAAASPPAVVVVGTVLCDTCFGGEPFKASSRHIPGALVSVECGGDNAVAAAAAPAFRREVRTNRHGVFRVRLPVDLSTHIDKIKSCSVKLVSSSKPFCTVSSSATAATSTPLRLKGKKKAGRLHVYSAGFFTFRPLQQPDLCYQKIPLLPPPTIGGVPIPPNPFQPPSLLPPNPFQPPPSLLPPNPFQPSPPSLLPPNPFQPPPASILPPLFNPPPPPPFFSFPPLLPGINPPSPPPPSFRFPPLIPFLPNPLFPGIPPSAPSKATAAP